MVWFALSFLTIIIAFVLLITIYYIQKETRYFDEHKKRGVVEIVGYDRKDRISLTEATWDFSVRFVNNEEIENNKVFLCLTEGLNSKDYPIGTKINVWYAKKGRAVHMEMEEHPPKRNLKLREVVKTIGICFLAISILFLAIGIFA